MTPPRSFVGTLASLRIFDSFARRALVFGILAAILAFLSFFPERYRTAVTLTPTDPQSLGLSGTLGQLGAMNSVFGNQAAVEVALRVANSISTRDIVIQRLKLEQRLGRDRTGVQRWLEDKVTVRSLRGGIIVMEMTGRDSVIGRDIVRAYADATQERLGQISRQQTAYKRRVLVQLVDEAARDLAQAQATYDTFRLTNRSPTPTTAVEAISSRIPQLEAGVKTKQIELAAARQLYTDTHPIVRQRSAELRTLEQQLAATRATSAGTDSTVGQAVRTSSRLYKLERDLTIARALYDSYLRYLQGTAVEDLTSTANVRILEPAYVDTERQVWWPLLAAAIAVILTWGAIEFYRMRPPVGARLAGQTNG